MELKYLFHVFVVFMLSSLMVFIVLLYNISKIFDDRDENRWSRTVAFDDDRPLGFNLWSRDPGLMDEVASLHTRSVNAERPAIIQISFNASCFVFVWSRLCLGLADQHLVEVTNLKVTSMNPIVTSLSGHSVKFRQCGLNTSTPYKVSLFTLGARCEQGLAATGVLWTAHQVPLPPSPPEVTAVTETSITLTLPETSLAEGPLSAVEIRIRQIDREHSPTQADKGPTAADKGATQADKGPTAADKGPTAADKGATQADKGATAADKGPTQADKGPRHGKRLRRDSDSWVSAVVLLLSGMISSPRERRRELSLRDGDKREGPLRDGDKREGPLRDGDKRELPLRDGNKREGPLRDGDGDKREGPLRDGDKREGPLRDGDKREGPLRDGDKREEPLRDGDKREGPLRDEDGDKREGPLRDGDKREGPLRDGDKREGPLRDGDKREGPLRDGDKREGPLRDGDKREGPLRDGDKREGPLRDGDGDKREEPLRDGDKREGPLRDGDKREGPLRDGDGDKREEPLRDGDKREGPLRDGDKREGPLRDGDKREGPLRDGDGDKREGPLRDGDKRELPLRDGDKREGPLRDGDKRDGPLRDGDKRELPLRDGDKREGPLRDGDKRDGPLRDGDKRELPMRDGDKREGPLRDEDGDKREGPLRDGDKREGPLRDGDKREEPLRDGDGGRKIPLLHDERKVLSRNEEVGTGLEMRAMLHLEVERRPVSGKMARAANGERDQGTGHQSQSPEYAVITQVHGTGQIPPHSAATDLIKPTLDEGNRPCANGTDCEQAKPEQARPDQAKPDPQLAVTLEARATRTLWSAVWQALASMRSQLATKVPNRATFPRRRRKRSLLSLKRHYSGTFELAQIREIESSLGVDPFQTWSLTVSAAGQSVLVKTGHGYFLTDHYGVRQPYYNDSRMESALRRFSFFQEARDFLLYGQSLLNLTNLSELDVAAVVQRLDRVIQLSRRRRYTIYLNLFEDWLFWRDKENEGYTIPPKAKLGLPPGVPVAHFTTGLTQNVTLGDDKNSGGLENPALRPGQEYEVVLMIVSTVAGVSKHSWTSINVSTLAVGSDRRSSSQVRFAASAGLLLLVLLIGLAVWRRSCAPKTLRTRSSSMSDLWLRAPRYLTSAGDTSEDLCQVYSRNYDPARCYPRYSNHRD